MNRRELLKKAGLGSIALVSLLALPLLINILATPASAAGQTNFRFMALSHAAFPHVFIMNGDGKITPSQVVGGGSFVHFDDSTLVPKTLIAFGTWKAKRLISFNLIGTYGGFAAGVLEMEVHLIPNGGSVIPATLKVVCNIPPAGLFVAPEGFTLTIPGTGFVPGGTFGPFVPFAPPMGLSIFTTGVEQRD